MCILLNVKKHEKTFALNVDIFKCKPNNKNWLTNVRNLRMIGKESIRTIPFCDMRTGMQNLRTIEFKIRQQK